MTDTTIPNETLRQLGGRNQLAAMTGSKNFTAVDDRTLSFRIPGTMTCNRNKCNYIKITLDANDTYRVEFGKVWGSKYRTIAIETDIYVDRLVKTIEEATGAYLNLGTAGRRDAVYWK